MSDRRRNLGYEEIITPSVLNVALWKKTGHYQHYAENMFLIDDKYGFKPMNCPGAALYVKNQFPASTKLPIRIFELGKVFRRELSGVNASLKRSNVFTQDDSHIFLFEHHIKEQVRLFLSEVDFLFSNLFPCAYRFVLSTTENHLRSVEMLRECLQGREHSVSDGEGAFYGPKIDVMLNTDEGEIQMSTFQLDYLLSEKLNLKFDFNDARLSPITAHFALFGSLERFLYLMLNGRGLPFWVLERPFAFADCGNLSNRIQRSFCSRSISCEMISLSDMREWLKRNFDSDRYLIAPDKQNDRYCWVRKRKENSRVAWDELSEWVEDSLKLVDDFRNGKEF